jgi:hypothetical protein
VLYSKVLRRVVRPEKLQEAAEKYIMGALFKHGRHLACCVIRHCSAHCYKWTALTSRISSN